MVALLHGCDARADFAHDAGALMAQDAREHALGIEPVEGVGVGVADAGGHDLHQHLARLGTLEVELDDLQRLLGFEGDGGPSLHGVFFM